MQENRLRRKTNHSEYDVRGIPRWRKRLVSGENSKMVRVKLYKANYYVIFHFPGWQRWPDESCQHQPLPRSRSVFDIFGTSVYFIRCCTNFNFCLAGIVSWGEGCGQKNYPVSERTRGNGQIFARWSTQIFLHFWWNKNVHSVNILMLQGVYTRVNRYLNWVNNNTADSCPCPYNPDNNYGYRYLWNWVNLRTNQRFNVFNFIPIYLLF